MESTQYSTLLVGWRSASGICPALSPRRFACYSTSSARPSRWDGQNTDSSQNTVSSATSSQNTDSSATARSSTRTLDDPGKERQSNTKMEAAAAGRALYFVAAERASSCVTASSHPDRRSLCAEHPCRTHPQRPPTSTGSRQPLPGEKHGGGTRGVTSSCSTEALSGANSRPSQVQAAGLQQVSSCRHLGG